MSKVIFNDKTYHLDSFGFLESPEKWDRDFAEGLAPLLGLVGGLTEKHWEIITFIRKYVEENKSIPLLYQTCLETGLSLN